VRPAAVAAAAMASLLLAPASAGASTTRSPVSLVASPARVTLSGSGRATVQVTNSGSRRVQINVRLAGFALDLRGRPRIVRRVGTPRTATTWLTVRPRTLSIAPGKKAWLTIASSVPRRARSGDHNALVLLTTRPIRGARVAVRMRLGVIVVVRAPGQIARQLELRRLRVRRAGRTRRLELLVANRGNVTEVLERKRVTIVLRRAQRIVARVQPTARELLPQTSGLVLARYAGRVRGRVTAVVELSSGPGGRALRREFHIRL
jgi:hypothetical protein